MGSCCSCFKRILSPLSSQSGGGSGGGIGGRFTRTQSSDTTETELVSNKRHQQRKKHSSNTNTYSLTISDTMSAPTILAYETNNKNDNVEEEGEEKPTIGQVRISGYGLALINMPIEQDAAYWEWFIEKDDGRRRRKKQQKPENDDDDEEDEYLAMKFGVATKKDPSFYQVQESSADEGKTKRNKRRSYKTEDEYF